MFNTATKFKLSLEKDLVKLTDLNPSLLKEVKVIDIKWKDDLNDKLIEEILQQDVVVLRNFSVASGIVASVFDPQNIKRQHGEDIVDVV